MSNTIEVKPLPTPKWHGKKGKESFTQPKSIEVLYDHTTGKYATGLTPEQAEEYGRKMGVSLSDIYDFETPHPYWSTKAAAIKLPNSTAVFRLDVPAEFVKVQNMKASIQVANSWKEYEAGLWPDATHVIYDENEEVAVKASKVQKRNKIVAKLSSMSKDEKCNLIQVLAGKNLKGKSDDFVDVELEEIINENPDELIKYMKMEKAEVYNRAVVLEAIQKHVFTKEGLAVYYMGEEFAPDTETAIAKFASPDNQQFKAIILDKINK